MVSFLCGRNSIAVKPTKSIHKIHRTNGLGECSISGAKNKSNKSEAENQDAYISYISEHESGRSIFAVFDGHGSSGHLVSQFCRSRLLSTLESEGFDVIKTFQNLQHDLEWNNNTNYNDSDSPPIDSECSGTTCTLVQIQNGILYCSNVGDSKALLATRNTNNQLQGVELTFDHKPDDESERQRIIKNGGKVYSNSQGTEDDGERVPIRVWYTTGKGTQMGLAMTRSIGDIAAHKVGVSCEPSMAERKLEENDEFIVIGSDGLFDVLKNDEILTTINNYMATLPPDEHRYAWKPAYVANMLATKARKRWIEYSDYIDDITCCVSNSHAL